MNFSKKIFFRVLLPYGNKKDIIDIPDEVKAGLR